MTNTQREQRYAVRMPKRELQQRLNRVVEQELTPTQREILVAYYFQLKNMPQIARERNISVSAVSHTLRRAEEKIKRYLQY